MVVLLRLELLLVVVELLKLEPGVEVRVLKVEVVSVLGVEEDVTPGAEVIETVEVSTLDGVVWDDAAEPSDDELPLDVEEVTSDVEVPVTDRLDVGVGLLGKTLLVAVLD